MASMEQQLWAEEEEAVEVGLRRKSESRRQSEEETAVNGKECAATFTEGIESIGVITVMTNTIPAIISKTEILTELPIPQLPLKTSLLEPDIQLNTSNINGTTTNELITTIQESKHYYGDMYLEPTFQKQPTQEFFCPNCNTCIRKVVLRDSDWRFVPGLPPVAPEPVVIREPEPVRCTSCFSFLIPVGTWFNTLIRVKKEDDDEEEGNAAERTPILISRGPGTFQIPEVEEETGEENEPHSEKLDGLTEKGPKHPILEEVVIDGKTSEENKSSEKLDGLTEIPEEAKIQEKARDPAETELPISAPIVAGPPAGNEPAVSAVSGGGENWEILKSVVYGGLAESITSLSVVTSAAAANVSSLNLVAMALANLIGGFFVIIHNIWDLKAEQARTVLNENEEEDRYERQLGQRKHFALHATLVLLSFLVFGIEPPLVYGFSFRESDNRDYKLAAVAGASFICISLLALGKAHIQKPSSYRVYIKTLVYYLVIGFAASGISYLAGDLIRELLDKLGLFKSESEAAIFLPFNGVRAVNPTWSSY